MPSLALKTLGCKVNQAEADQMLFDLASTFKLVNFKAEADFYVINACSVTSEAESKVRQLIRQAKKRNPAATIVLTGCFRPEAKKLWHSLGVSLTLANSQKHNISKELIERFSLKTEKVKQNKLSHLKTRAFVKVQDGCDQYCSYCLIPYLRSRKKSQPLKVIINEVNKLVADGYQEIVLCGINLGKYGDDLPEKIDLPALIKTVIKETNIGRIRLSSLNIEDVNEPLLTLLKTEPRVAKHLHLSLQSGSDYILQLMHRRYTATDFLTKVKLLKAEVPDIGITCDLIVGFPGETEADFQQSLELLREVKPIKTHIFKFSPRPLTLAATLPNKVSPEVKKERLQRAKQHSQYIAEEAKKQFIGKTLEVLLEKKENGYYTGFSSQYVKVALPEANLPLNCLLKAKAVKLQNELLLAKSVKVNNPLPTKV